MLRYPSGEQITVPRHVETGRVRTLLNGMVAAGAPGGTRSADGAGLGLAMRTPIRRLAGAVIGRMPEGPDEEARRAARFTIVCEAKVGSRTTARHRQRARRLRPHRGDDGRTARCLPPRPASTAAARWRRPRPSTRRDFLQALDWFGVEFEVEPLPEPAAVGPLVPVEATRPPQVPLEAGIGPANPPCPACGEPLFGWATAPDGAPVRRCEACGLGVVGEPGAQTEALAELERLRIEGGGDPVFRIANRASFAAWIGGKAWAPVEAGHALPVHAGGGSAPRRCPRPEAGADALATLGWHRRDVGHAAELVHLRPQRRPRRPRPRHPGPRRSAPGSAGSTPWSACSRPRSS